jgi:hypothetical protein
MAVFDELNKGSHRFEDPEVRQAEKIQRKGEAKNLKRKSSGVTFQTYRVSLAVGYWLVGLGVVGAICFLGYMAVSAFIGG